MILSQKKQCILFLFGISLVQSAFSQTTFNYTVKLNKESAINVVKNKGPLVNVGIKIQKGDSLSWQSSFKYLDTIRTLNRNLVIGKDSTFIIPTYPPKLSIIQIPEGTKCSIKQKGDTLFYDIWPLSVNEKNVNFLLNNGAITLTDLNNLGISDIDSIKKKDLKKRISLYELNLYNEKVNQDKYYTIIKPREVVSFKFHNYEVGAFTVPFKMRADAKGYEIKNRLTKSFNANFYGGFSYGRIKYTYRKLEDVEPRKIFGNFGAFIGFDVQTVDSTDSKYLAEKQYKDRDLGYLSTGLFVGYSLNDLKFGLSFGIDLGVGEAARKSAYNKSVWFGFGLGYKLPFIKNP